MWIVFQYFYYKMIKAFFVKAVDFFTNEFCKFFPSTTSVICISSDPFFNRFSISNFTTGAVFAIASVFLFEEENHPHCRNRHFLLSRPKPLPSLRTIVFWKEIPQARALIYFLPTYSTDEHIQ